MKITGVPVKASIPKNAAAYKSKYYPWVVVAILMLLYTSSFIDRQILALLVKPMRAYFHISDTQFSYLTGLAFALLYSTAGVPLGYIVDHGNRTRLIAAGVAIWSVMTAACGFVTSYWGLFLARLGVGVGEATLSPASYSLITDIFKPSQLARALSIFSLGVPIGAGLALVIGGPLVEVLTNIGPINAGGLITIQPWQMVFLLIGLPGLLWAVLTLFAVREPPRSESRTEEQAASHYSVGSILSHLWIERKLYAPLFLGFAMIALYWYGASAWLPSYLQRVRGFSIGQAGIFLGVSSLVLGVIGTPLAGALADYLISRGRNDGHFLVGMLFGVGSLCCGGLGAVVTARWLSLSLIFFHGLFAFTLVGVNAAAFQLVTPNRMRGQLSAIYLFVLNLISLGLGPTAVAFSTDFIFRDEKAVGSSIALVGLVSVTTGCLIMLAGRKIVAARVGQSAMANGSSQMIDPRPK